MKSRVHYTNPEGRPAFKDLTSTKEDAAGVFTHLYPGCKVLRVEALVLKMPAPTLKQSAEPPALKAPITLGLDIAAGLKAFREQLRGKSNA